MWVYIIYWYTKIHMYMYIYIYMYMYIYIYICTCIYVYVYIYIHICVCAYLYLYPSHGIQRDQLLDLPNHQRVEQCSKVVKLVSTFTRSNLVGGMFQPLWNIWVRQLGWLFPTEWENKSHVPNHQPAINNFQDPHAISLWNPTNQLTEVGLPLLSEGGV